MVDKIKYINHLNESVEFGKSGILIDSNNMRDYQWSYDTQYSKITGFKRKISKASLPILVYGSDAKKKANGIIEITEKDVLTSIPGTLYVGEYYKKGYFYQKKNKKYLKGDVISFDLTFVTDSSCWVKEKTYIYRINGSAQSGIDYPYDYPFDYLANVNADTLYNESYNASDFILNIYGAVENPTITIGGQIYNVNVSLAKNEYLTINSKDKTIIKTTMRGKKENVFSYRNKENYIFKKIKVGTNLMYSSPVCDFNVTLFDVRSEPIWT